MSGYPVRQQMLSGGLSSKHYNHLEKKNCLEMQSHTWKSLTYTVNILLWMISPHCQALLFFNSWLLLDVVIGIVNVLNFIT